MGSVGNKRASAITTGWLQNYNSQHIDIKVEGQQSFSQIEGGRRFPSAGTPALIQTITHLSAVRVMNRASLPEIRGKGKKG